MNFSTPICLEGVKSKEENNDSFNNIVVDFLSTLSPDSIDVALALLNSSVVDQDFDYMEKVDNEGQSISEFCDKLRVNYNSIFFCGQCKNSAFHEEYNKRKNDEFHVIAHLMLAARDSDYINILDLQQLRFYDTFVSGSEAVFSNQRIIDLYLSGFEYDDLKEKILIDCPEALVVYWNDLFMKIETVDVSRKQYLRGVEFLIDGDTEVNKLYSIYWKEIKSKNCMYNVADKSKRVTDKNKKTVKGVPLDSMEMLFELVSDSAELQEQASIPIAFNTEDEPVIKKERKTSTKKAKAKERSENEKTLSKSDESQLSLVPEIKTDESPCVECNVESKVEKESFPKGRDCGGVVLPLCEILETKLPESLRKELLTATHICVEYDEVKGIIVLCLFSFDKESVIYQFAVEDKSVLSGFIPAFLDSSIVKITYHSTSLIGVLASKNIEIKNVFMIETAYSTLNYHLEYKGYERVIKELTGVNLDHCKSTMSKYLLALKCYRSIYRSMNEKMFDAITYSQLKLEELAMKACARGYTWKHKSIPEDNVERDHFCVVQNYSKDELRLMAQESVVLTAKYSNVDLLFEGQFKSAMGTDVLKFATMFRKKVFEKDIYRRVLAELYRIGVHKQSKFKVVGGESGVTVILEKNVHIFRDSLHHIMRNLSREINSTVEPDILISVYK